MKSATHDVAAAADQNTAAQDCEGAFDAIFEAHRDDVYRTALAILGRRDLALDALQDTFIKVHRALKSFRGDSTLRTWIVRIAVRSAIDIRRRAPERHEPLSEVREPSHDPRPGIEDSLRLERLRKLADSLAGQGGVILRLRLFSGQSNKEIASHLEITEANVRVQLSNAVRKLKELL